MYAIEARVDILLANWLEVAGDRVDLVERRGGLFGLDLGARVGEEGEVQDDPEGSEEDTSRENVDLNAVFPVSSLHDEVMGNDVGECEGNENQPKATTAHRDA